MVEYLRIRSASFPVFGPNATVHDITWVNSTHKWVSRYHSIAKLIGFSFHRLPRNSRCTDLWSTRIQNGQDPTLPTLYEGTYLCSRIHSCGYYCWSSNYSIEAKAVSSSPEPGPLKELGWEVKSFFFFFFFLPPLSSHM